MGELQEKLQKYSEQNYCPMHMPGHKRNTKLLGNVLPYNIDITEINDFDDLHHPEGIIKNIQEKAQKIYKAEKSFILVNGSTCGILAGIRSLVNEGDTILVARNCHKSVYNAIELNNLKPVYIQPNIDKTGIMLDVEPQEVEQKLKENPNIKLIVLTSPTYEGVISNLKEIVKIAHKHKIPVLVDEAHGAHISFIKEITEQEAINAGADVVIQSLHKTLPALTQTALLHTQGEFVNNNEVARQLSIFETSSPSYILMASIEECLDILENKKELFEEYQKNIKEFYQKAKKLQKLEILGNTIKNKFYDYGKIVILTNNTNINGKKLAEILRKNYKIETEMAYTNYVIAMTSICDSKENFERLINALLEIDKKIEPKKNNENEKEPIINNLIAEIPKSKMSIQEVVQNNIKANTLINYKDAEGKVAKEYIWVYPPGIPILTPGEVINKNIIAQLDNFVKEGIEVRTNSNKFPKITIC